MGRELIIHDPQDTETLEQYFGRYKDDELRLILDDPVVSIEFCSNLLSTRRFALSEPTNQLRKLSVQIKYLNDFGSLKHFVQELKSVRYDLLKSLEETANHIEEYSKYGSIVRFICCVSDIAGTVGGLWMRDSKFDHSGKAFMAARSFGLLSPITAFMEMFLLKNTFENVMKLIQKDEEHFSPIRRWFEHTESLKETFLNILPFDNRDDIVKQAITAKGTEFCRVDLLASLFRIVKKQGIKHIRNTEFVTSMITLFSDKGITDLFEWMIFHHSQGYPEGFKMLLQLQYSPVKFLHFQNLPFFTPNNSDSSAAPVWGRIFFDSAIMMDSVKTLRNSDMLKLACELRSLRSNLESQMDALERITQRR